MVEDRERAGNGVATVIVDELDARGAELNERGIETGEVEQLNVNSRTLMLADPDGNPIQLGQISSAD